jgi:transposase InsO family protein
MGIRDKPTAPASPWQNGFAERLIGSIRRECLNHIVVSGEAHLRRVLRTYAGYYNKIRTHRSLDKDAPISRPVQRPEASNHTLFWVDFITITPGSKFSAYTPVRTVGSEVFPNENYLTSVLQPAEARTIRWIASVIAQRWLPGEVCGQARFFTRNAA